MFITIVFSLIVLAIVALCYYTYYLSVQIKDLKLTVDVSKIAFKDRFRSVEERLENQTTRLNSTTERLVSLEFIQKLHSQQIKCIKVIMWD